MITKVATSYVIGSEHLRWEKREAKASSCKPLINYILPVCTNKKLLFNYNNNQ